MLSFLYHLERFTQLTETIFSVQLAPIQKNHILAYQAGQYTEILFPDGSYQPFSIANAPNSENTIELHIRARAQDQATKDFLIQLQQTKQVILNGAHGHCVYLSRLTSSRPCILIAGGTGFAQCKALIEEKIKQNHPGEIYFYWCVNSNADFYLPDLPKTWAKQLSQFQYIPFIQQKDKQHLELIPQGIQEKIITDHPSLADYSVYISGPAGLVFTAAELFQQHGLDKKFIYSDMLSYPIEHEIY